MKYWSLSFTLSIWPGLFRSLASSKLYLPLLISPSTTDLIRNLEENPHDSFKDTFVCSIIHSRQLNIASRSVRLTLISLTGQPGITAINLTVKMFLAFSLFFFFFSLVQNTFFDYHNLPSSSSQVSCTVGKTNGRDWSVLSSLSFIGRLVYHERTSTPFVPCCRRQFEFMV